MEDKNDKKMLAEETEAAAGNKPEGANRSATQVPEDEPNKSKPVRSRSSSSSSSSPSLSSPKNKANPYLSSSSGSESDEEEQKPQRRRSHSKSSSTSKKAEPIKKEEEEAQEHRKKRSRSRSHSHASVQPPSIRIPGLNGPLMSRQQFMAMQRKPVDSAEAEKKYEEYKTTHTRKQDEIFFSLHKDDPWFREKYDPEQIYEWNCERRVQTQLLAKKFFENVRSGFYAGLKLEQTAPHIEEPEGRADLSKAPYFGFDPSSMSLYLDTIPAFVSRKDLLTVVKDTPGFQALSMSEPLRNLDFARYAWVSYDSEANCAKSKLLLENLSVKGVKLSPIKTPVEKKPIKVTPVLTEGREVTDLELSRKLIGLLDEDKQIKENEMLMSQEIADPVRKLDLQLTYLRKVHAVCYYSCEEYDDERLLSSKCGPVYIRAKGRISPAKASSETRAFETKIDNFVSSRLAKGPANKSPKKPGEDDAELRKKKQDFYRPSDDGHKCGFCSKTFSNEQYVLKHIDSRHNTEAVYVEKLKEHFEELMFRNYVGDPDRFTNKPTGEPVPPPGTLHKPNYSQHYPSTSSSHRSYYHQPRGRYQGRYQRGGSKERRERQEKYEQLRKAKQESYVDFDNPEMGRASAQEPLEKAAAAGRMVINYDDL